MSVIYGNAQFIYSVVSLYLIRVLFLYITLPLMALWVIVGLVFDLPSSVVTGISIHVYVNIIIFAIGGFKAIFPIAVGMGSTRVQFLKSYYLTGLGAVFATILLLNVCQYVLMAVYELLMGWSNILHPAVLFLDEYQFLSYFGIDLMVGLLLFGLTFLVYCIWHRLGTVYSLVILVAAAFPVFFLYYGGVVDSWFRWLLALNLSAAVVVSSCGAIGLTALVCTYPLMRNAPLQPKPARD